MTKRILTLLAGAALVAGLFFTVGAPLVSAGGGQGKDMSIPPIPEVTSPSGKVEVAILAGGCFWCVQPPFDKTKGVLATSVGFTGGAEENPTYSDVSWGRTGHTEAIHVQFDPAQVSYAQILDVFWRSMDPTDAKGQFVDRGSQYRPGIFYTTDEQKKVAETSRDALAASGRFKKPIVVEITKAGAFWPAENYHQQYYKKEPAHYQRYRSGSGRDAFIERHWGDDAPAH